MKDYDVIGIDCGLLDAAAIARDNRYADRLT
jgi:hypothetical protein